MERDQDEEISKLRSSAFAEEDQAMGLVQVEHKGLTYEVRAPTLDEQKRLTRACTDAKTKEVDGYRLGVKLIIACTFAPGGEKRVFNAADEDTLMKRRAGRGSLLEKLIKAVKRAQTPDEQEIDAGFEEPPTSSSST